MNIKFIVLVLCSVPLHARLMDEVHYSLASADAQQQKWDQAEQRINTVMLNAPDRPDLLYDAGVVAYRNKKFEQAHACFEHGLQSTALDDELKEQLCFNAGNTCVELQQLKEAIGYYEKVLALNNKHERARHNLEVVKNMLKQQEQEQQEQKDNQNNDQQKEDQQSGNQNQNNNQKNNEKQQSEKQQREQDNGKQNEQQSESKKQGNKDQEKQDEQKDGTKKQNEGQRNDRGNQPEPRNPSQQSHDKQKQQEHADSQSKNNKPSPQNKQKTSVAQSQTGYREAEQFDKNEQWMIELLQEQEKADKQANKQILHGMVQKNLAGNDGQNCW